MEREKKVKKLGGEKRLESGEGKKIRKWRGKKGWEVERGKG